MKTRSRQFSWETVKERLARSDAAVTGAALGDGGILARTLRQRAQQLANRNSEAHAKTARTAILTFQVGEPWFAFELADVAQAATCPQLTRVPGGGEHLLGVANFQGRMISVFDLAGAMQLPPTSDAGGSIVMVRCGGALVGIRADVLGEVRRVDLTRLASVEQAAHDAQQGMVRGLTDDGVAVLNLKSLVNAFRSSRHPSHNLTSAHLEA